MFGGVFFTVFAYKSGLSNVAWESGKSWTLGTRQEVIHHKDNTEALPPLHQHPSPAHRVLGGGHRCHSIQAAINQRAPFGSSHVEEIKAYF